MKPKSGFHTHPSSQLPEAGRILFLSRRVTIVILNDFTYAMKTVLEKSIDNVSCRASMLFVTNKTVRTIISIK